MRTVRSSVCWFRRLWVCGFWIVVVAVMAMCVAAASAQDSPSTDAPPQPDKNVPVVQEPAPVERPEGTASGQVAQEVEADGGLQVFENRIPADQMAFLNGLAGVSSSEVIRDKQFKRLMKFFVPSCEFHYGRDMVSMSRCTW